MVIRDPHTQSAQISQNVRFMCPSACMSCHKDIVVMTGTAHCFHDLYIYIYIIWVKKNSKIRLGLVNPVRRFFEETLRG